ncbi:DUF3159 domain-containing protein [Micrococcus sp.]|uniref:DUF3159 domain-containing protein n=1 Tax=Micrococcus sp. TaxID=1271 RepID=UPI0026DCF27E|nr:DUF3159 domain-containing protein [Micrococcus sp.]MDO4240741.1 DUF3159 domain-containing protein [Micrococcus sp.]
MTATPPPADPARPSESAGPDAARAGLAAGPAVDERGRLDPLASVGGVRGIVEASLPTFVFLLASLVTGQVWPAGLAALAVAVAMGVVRLAQRQSPVQVLAGVVVVGLSVALALTTGRAADFYVWGLVTNAVYLVAMAVSVAVRWPLAGVLFGLVRGEGTEWRTSPARRRQYAAATWIVAGVFAARLAVQLPMYLADAATGLGIARVVMGLPLYALGLWLAWSVSSPRGSAPGAPASAPSTDARRG